MDAFEADFLKEWRAEDKAALAEIKGELEQMAINLADLNTQLGETNKVLTDLVTINGKLKDKVISQADEITSLKAAAGAEAAADAGVQTDIDALTNEADKGNDAGAAIVAANKELLQDGGSASPVVGSDPVTPTPVTAGDTTTI